MKGPAGDAAEQQAAGGGAEGSARAGGMEVVAIARRSGEWWSLEVPEIPGFYTQVRDLSEAPAQVEDAIRTLLEEPVTRVRVLLQSQA